jgi:antitoxin MazE
MKAKLARWGNSLALRIPAEMARDFALREGQVVELERKGAVIELQPAARPTWKGVPIVTIEELVEEMKRLGPRAEPETIDWGPDVGSEIIDDEYARGEITLDGDPDDPAGRR